MIAINELREKAYRNMLVCAIDEALRLGVFTLNHDDEWEKPGLVRVIDFYLPNGLPAKAGFGDIGFGEISVKVTVNPKGDSAYAG